MLVRPPGGNRARVSSGARRTHHSIGPLKGRRIEWPPRDGVENLQEIATEFMLKVFGLEPSEYLITDESPTFQTSGRLRKTTCRKPLDERPSRSRCQGRNPGTLSTSGRRFASTTARRSQLSNPATCWMFSDGSGLDGRNRKARLMNTKARFLVTKQRMPVRIELQPVINRQEKQSDNRRKNRPPHWDRRIPGIHGSRT